MRDSIVVYIILMLMTVSMILMGFQNSNLASENKDLKQQIVAIEEDKQIIIDDFEMVIELALFEYQASGKTYSFGDWLQIYHKELWLRLEGRF